MALALRERLSGKGPTALLALFAGAACAFAHPPFGVLPGLLGYALLLWSLDRVSPERPLRSAFWRAWLAGVAYFFIGVWWIVEAFLVDAENQGWMAPFAIIISAATLGAFWGLAGLVYRASQPSNALWGWTRVLVFAGAMALAEWLRGVLLAPWNLPGETWRAGGLISQSAALVGSHALTFITVAVAAAPALLIEKGQRRTGAFVCAGAAVLLAAMAGFGAWRVTQVPQSKGPLVRVVQANVPQAAKYDEAFFRDIVTRYVTLTAKPAAAVPDIVIWPEGALPLAVEDYIAPDTWTRDLIMGALRPGQTLIVGGYRIQGTPAKPIYRNSLFVLRRTATDLVIEAVYDKHRLVPFGEFLPFEDLMGRIGVKQLVHVGDGFTPGERPKPMAGSGEPPFLPLICYESLFPRFAVQGGRKTGIGRAAWIVNISNDAWFGQTSGPWQHLNLASYRAIEEGLPMVRSTPTGVSAVIDAAGRPLQKLELGRYGVIDANLPAPFPHTPYESIGNLGFWLLILASLSLTVRQIVHSGKSG